MQPDYFHPIRAARQAFDKSIRGGKAKPLTAVERALLAVLILLLPVLFVATIATFGAAVWHTVGRGTLFTVALVPVTITAVGLVWSVRPAFYMSALGFLALTRGPRKA